MSRVCKDVRETKETKVLVEFNLDEPGDVEVSTPIPFFNHMLETMFVYMNSRASILTEEKKRVDDHHIVEDTAITIGNALDKCLGDRVGVKRFSHQIIPMDDALILIAVDISGRGGSFIELNFTREAIGGLSLENVSHFIDSLAKRSGITIHVIKLKGLNDHHVVEAIFKGLGIALYDATRVVGGSIKSLKGVLK
ncbi:imidazoleglycerol-phosphate dehydratase [Ignisphaera sp. 4213-co]|uniref:Imidazoleglycerol-phosphate dehydratase n=1 Tax=Ignisphaera cupida TaxID=3050454 RepID=A0ABD4Z4Y1_9CREN|nr:imidazoleglycerol-phosphate dehydratase [Ignisphaera sp. 4213-co]MDK6028376.1 imidazoleglycerol-phosphate dehydratase [Ignisphaera sp. 4213-co]